MTCEESYIIFSSVVGVMCLGLLLSRLCKRWNRRVQFQELQTPFQTV